MLHLQHNILNAKRRPSDVTLEAQEDNAMPVSNEVGILGACDSLEVGSPSLTKGNAEL